MKVEQASCSQDAPAQWEKKQPTRHHRAVRKMQGGTSGSRRGLLQLREEGAQSGVPKPSLSKVSNTLLLPTPGHFPGSVAQPSWRCRCDSSLPSPPPPHPPELHCPLLVSSSFPGALPPPLLLFSGDVVVLSPWAVLIHPAHTSAQPPGPLHASVSQPLSVRCPEVNSGYLFPASRPPTGATIHSVA